MSNTLQERPQSNFHETIDNIESLISGVENKDVENKKATCQRQLISFVIPVMNEEETIIELCKGIANNVPEEFDHEIILIDDGSTDDSWAVIETMAKACPERYQGIKFRANRGKAAGLTAGYRAVRGDIMFTMDADLQDDPKEIPNFLAKLSEGYDLVSGWKKVRHDPWHKVLPSRVFNRMLSFLSEVRLHDHNCGFKCYRRSVVDSLSLHGELHRMVPALAGMAGFKVTEIEVLHHPRRFGSSKYGIERFIRGFSDMLTIGFLRRFRERPAHFFNAAAVFYFTVSMGLVALGAAVPRFDLITFSLVALLFGGLGGTVVLAGLVCETVIRGDLSRQENSAIIRDTRCEFRQS